MAAGFGSMEDCSGLILRLSRRMLSCRKLTHSRLSYMRLSYGTRTTRKVRNHQFLAESKETAEL